MQHYWSFFHKNECFECMYWLLYWIIYKKVYDKEYVWNQTLRNRKSDRSNSFVTVQVNLSLELYLFLSILNIHEYVQLFCLPFCHYWQAINLFSRRSLYFTCPTVFVVSCFMVLGFAKVCCWIESASNGYYSSLLIDLCWYDRYHH